MLWQYTVVFLTSLNYKKAVDVLVSTAQRFKFHTCFYLSATSISKGNKEAVLAIICGSYSEHGLQSPVRDWLTNRQYPSNKNTIDSFSDLAFISGQNVPQFAWYKYIFMV